MKSRVVAIFQRADPGRVPDHVKFCRFIEIRKESIGPKGDTSAMKFMYSHII